MASLNLLGSGTRWVFARNLENVENPGSEIRLHDAAVDFVYRLCLPAESGFVGGIVAMLHDSCGVVLSSPWLDSNGNLLHGTKEPEWLTPHSGLCVT